MVLQILKWQRRIVLTLEPSNQLFFENAKLYFTILVLVELQKNNIGHSKGKKGSGE
jgi:hypothetical protein